jgi:hypothetical protein
MGQETRRTPIQLTATKPIELDPGVVLPPGTYTRTSKQTALHTQAGATSTKPEYKLELTAEQLTSMGATNMGNYVSIEYDVSKFVRSGDISIE